MSIEFEKGYKYSTTYTPGQQSIDYDNSGSPNQINKWLELYWKNLDQITNKQIMIKLKATELDEKFILKYRDICVKKRNKIIKNPTKGTFLGA